MPKLKVKRIALSDQLAMRRMQSAHIRAVSWRPSLMATTKRLPSMLFPIGLNCDKITAIRRESMEIIRRSTLWVDILIKSPLREEIFWSKRRV